MQALNEMIVIGAKQSNIIIYLKKECKGYILFTLSSASQHFLQQSNISFEDFIFLQIGIATNGSFRLVRHQPIVKNISSQNIN